LNISTEDKFFDKTSAESCPEKGQSLKGIPRNHPVKSGTIPLERSQEPIGEISDRGHREQDSQSNPQITNNSPPVCPFSSNHFLPGDSSFAPDTDERGDEGNPQESNQNERELQERMSMLRTLRIDVRDREGPRPTQNKWERE
jgi:hypothetical protein